MSVAPVLLVPLDGSFAALAALPVARSLAHVMAGSVMVVHVTDETLSSPELLRRVKLTNADSRMLTIERCAGAAAKGILQIASNRHADLIVMSAPTRSDGMYPFGGVPGEVLRMAPCPVILVPPGRGHGPWTLNQIALPHDGTPTSAAAIGPTANLAARACADLVLIHVATPRAEQPKEPGTLVTPPYVDQPHHEFPFWRREFLDRVRCACRPTKPQNMRLVLARGDIGAAILEFAQRSGPDLIALAWRGCVGPDCAQTLRRVIRSARCPVIVFRVRP